MILSPRTLIFHNPAPVFYHKLSERDNQVRFAVYACPVMDKFARSL